MSVVPPAIQGAFEAALTEAERWIGATAPNPPVGAAALDREGRILEVAAHVRAGTEHAEAKLLRTLTEQGRVHEVETLVVTLEPCNHTGRTPPCVDAILKHPQIRAVWYGVSDPNPKVAGAGALRLAERGIAVSEIPSQDPLRARSERLIGPFMKWATQGLPFVLVKTAHHFDTPRERLTWSETLNTLLSKTPSPEKEEQIADHLRKSMIPPSGQKTFTQESSLKEVHALRKQSDAILTGSGTILSDDPSFTVRLVEDFPQPRKPRILGILDRRARVPSPWLEQARARGLLPQAFSPATSAELETVLRTLANQGVHQVLVEAGPSLSAAFLARALWDERIHYLHAASDDQESIADLKIHAYATDT